MKRFSTSKRHCAVDTPSSLLTSHKQASLAFIRKVIFNLADYIFKMDNLQSLLVCHANKPPAPLVDLHLLEQSRRSSASRPPPLAGKVPPLLGKLKVFQQSSCVVSVTRYCFYFHSKNPREMSPVQMLNSYLLALSVIFSSLSAATVLGFMSILSSPWLPSRGFMSSDGLFLYLGIFFCCDSSGWQFGSTK